MIKSTVATNLHRLRNFHWKLAFWELVAITAKKKFQVTSKTFTVTFSINMLFVLSTKISKSIWLILLGSVTQPFEVQVPVDDKNLYYCPGLNFLVLATTKYYVRRCKMCLNCISNHFYWLVFYILLILNIVNYKVSKLVQVPARRPPSPGTGKRPGGWEPLL